MKVSIIVPFYNVENLICDCLDSIFGQTYPDIELILVNDCSTDNSLKVVEHYCETKNPGFEIIIKSQERNGGASAARNVGIDCATGDYLLFVDADDQLTPTGIEMLVRPLKQKRYDVVIGDREQTGTVLFTKWRLKIDGGEWNDGQSIFREHCHQNIYINPFNKLCRRDFVLDNKLYFEEGVTHEDVLWSLRLCLNTESTFVVKEKTYIRISRNDSISGSELWADEVHAYIRLLPLIKKAIDDSPHKNCKTEINTYFDDIFFIRYRLCFLDHLKDEYVALRALDPRPASWILKKCMTSRMYVKAHIHRLLPSKLVFPLMFKYFDRNYKAYKQERQFRLTNQENRII